MKVLTSKKALICFLSIGSLVLAGTIKDYHGRTIRLESIEAVEKEIIPVERSVASESGLKVAQIYFPAIADNVRKINTEWEITRIVDNNENIAFDKLNNADDAKKSIKVPFELIGNGIVRVNKDNQQVYRISLLSEFGTIALFKKLGDGFEIIEAKKIAQLSNNAALVVDEAVELVLERALNQAKSNSVLEGDNVSGQVTLSSKAIAGLSVELRNPNGESQNIEIDTADLMDGGAFKAEVNGEEVSGVVLNNGKDGYRISFVTGPIAGSMLNFVTKDQMEKVEETRQEIPPSNDQDAQVANQTTEVEGAAPAQTREVANVEVVEQSAEKAIEERREIASDADNYVPVKVLSTDEVKATAEQNGFSF